MTANSKASFFSLFNLPARPFDPDFLITLGEEMSKTYSHAMSSSIPSGFVYLGQFIVHDLSRLEGGENRPTTHQEPIENLVQLNIPTLELDSVYGGESFGHADATSTAALLNDGRMVLGSSITETNEYLPGTDLPRKAPDANGIREALIGDVRNDENLITAQLHLQFLKLHNWFYDQISQSNPSASGRALYTLARTETILHYQEVVLYDFLRILLDEDVWNHVIRDDKSALWNPYPGELARMPIEFSGAAMRFGHSMVLPLYSLNADRELNLAEIFRMTGRGKFGHSIALPNKFVIDWRCFFTEEPTTADPPTNFAQLIDDDLSLTIPGSVAQTGYHYQKMSNRNLVRANQLGLPAGQDIAAHLLNPQFSDLIRAIGFNEDYANTTQEELTDPNGRISRTLRYLSHHNPDRDTQLAPLWYYILTEAKAHHRGQRLGKIGSLIIAETLKALAKLSRISLYRSQSSSSLFPAIRRSGSYKDASGTPKAYLKMRDLLELTDPH